MRIDVKDLARIREITENLKVSADGKAKDSPVFKLPGNYRRTAIFRIAQLDIVIMKTKSQVVRHYVNQGIVCVAPPAPVVASKDAQHVHRVIDPA